MSSIKRWVAFGAAAAMVAGGLVAGAAIMTDPVADISKRAEVRATEGGGARIALSHVFDRAPDPARPVAAADRRLMSAALLTTAAREARARDSETFAITRMGARIGGAPDAGSPAGEIRYDIQAMVTFAPAAEAAPLGIYTVSDAERQAAALAARPATAAR
ncbi:MAG: hypothetical protein AAFR16_14045 [Pseudomonadota bacterium]